MSKTEKLQKIFASEKMLKLFETFEKLDSPEGVESSHETSAYSHGRKALNIAAQSMAQLEAKAKAGEQAIAILRKIRDEISA